jgi:hypothetical protein
MAENTDYNERAELRKNLTAEGDAKKKLAIDMLNAEKQERLEKEKEAIRQRFLAGAQTEAEMKEELQALLHGDRAAYEAAMRNADKEKDRQS